MNTHAVVVTERDRLYVAALADLYLIGLGLFEDGAGRRVRICSQHESKEAAAAAATTNKTTIAEWDARYSRPVRGD